MTIQRARQLLGEEANKYTDEQLAQINENTAVICDFILDITRRENLTHKAQKSVL